MSDAIVIRPPRRQQREALIELARHSMPRNSHVKLWETLDVRYRGKNIRMYGCGPWGMMKAVHLLSIENDIQCEVSLEARMGCSLGACLGCVVQTRDSRGEEQYLRVCQDGPVMNSRLINWNTVPL